MLNHRSKTSVLVLATAASFGFVPAAQAQLTQVGPTLTRTNAKAETQVLLRHDRGVQLFLGLSAKSSASIVVDEARRFKCKIGTPRCPFNTGKRGWKLEKTSYRWGHWRWSYRVKFTYKGQTRYVTFHELSSNVLSGAKKGKKPKRIVVNRKPIKLRLIAVADASAAAGNTAETTCPAGTFARAKANARSGASSSAGASVKYVKTKAGSSAWKSLLKKINVFAEATASAQAQATVECVPQPMTPQPTPTPSPEPPAQKDGTTTPPTTTPTNPAPGQNPSPDPQDPAPGGHACYWESTGQPVPEDKIVIINGVKLCPTGSYGDPAV